MNHELTIPEAAKKYGFSVETIKCLIQTGRLVSIEKNDQTLLTPKAFNDIDLFPDEEVAELEQAAPGFAGLVAAHRKLVGKVAEIEAGDIAL